MSFREFELSLARDSGPPAGLSAPLRALWLEANGDWHGAHVMAQAAGDGDGPTARAGDWVHAYLHRKEGDAGNAAYWYARAGQPVANSDLAAEWQDIVRALLGATSAG